MTTITRRYPCASDLHTIALSSYKARSGSVVWTVGFVGATLFHSKTVAEALADLDLLRTINPDAAVMVSAGGQ